MSPLLKKVSTRNYRSLADVCLELGAVNVLFGPNGAGKSTFLDVLGFIQECSERGVDTACAARGQGIGLLWDGAGDAGSLEISLETAGLLYEFSLVLISGRFHPFPGERLVALEQGVVRISRGMGSPDAEFLVQDQPVRHVLRDPGKLSFSRFLDSVAPWDQGGVREISRMDRLLRSMHFLHARSFSLNELKKRGSEASHELRIGEHGLNLWSVLRNLHDRQRLDDRYATIMRFMAKSFPLFDGLAFEQTGANSIYGLFVEKGGRRPILASAVSDGHLQMLLLLAALFAEGREQESVLLLDEPEVSLHPWALAVLADAVKEAAHKWNKQVFIATHSPVLLSQFDPTDSFATERREGRTLMRRVSEIPGIKDLLTEYATGSLYMAEMVAPQQKTVGESGGEGTDG